MKNAEVLKYCINIAVVILLGVITYAFTAYGLLFKNLSFIEVHLNMLLSVTGAVCALFIIAGILFYIIKKQSLYRLTVCLLIFLAVFAAIFFALCAAGLLGKINSVESLREYISKSGKMAAVIYILFSFLQVTLLPVPGSITVAAGVAMFGPLRCSIYSFIGIVLGSFVAFFIGRGIGYKAVCWIVGKDSLDKWLQKLKGKDYLILSLMFLLPMFPDDILCFVAGLSSMTWNYYAVMIVLTRALSVLYTAYSFELIPFNTWWGVLIWAGIVGLIIVSFYVVFKYSDNIDRFLKRKFKFLNNNKNKED